MEGVRKSGQSLNARVERAALGSGMPAALLYHAMEAGSGRKEHRFVPWSHAFIVFMPVRSQSNSLS